MPKLCKAHGLKACSQCDQQPSDAEKFLDRGLNEVPDDAPTKCVCGWRGFDRACPRCGRATYPEAT